MSFQPLVLIIKDNPVLMKTALQKAGWRTCSAGSELNGMELARQELPDLILLDLRGLMDGCKTVAQLNVEPDTKTIPIIVLTKALTRHQCEQITAAGADGVWTKPYDLTRLVPDLTNFLFQH